MAGMLPGVESARRRRFHQSGDMPSVSTHGCSRRSSFCLYASNHKSSHLCSIRSLRRGVLNHASEDEKLGERAREAKERLDERLRNQSKSATRRDCSSGRPVAQGEFQTEVFSARSSRYKRFSWTKFSWRASDQDECIVCLEWFKPGDQLMHLPCAHRFHTLCLVPWLETNSHCPCCRMEIHVELS
ncbi:hypothetical protein K2173_017687 [Erythroxylum novogranatense]|uniref:RING-type domain-containing protein n=1 Tax=Erythroxylum novogranatense TaxID=1862640 RepID=A0AAV8SM39_9ROSI|nr:hypothetical protein K2173_017687 [Erythroxylum novogranatense]